MPAHATKSLNVRSGGGTYSISIAAGLLADVAAHPLVAGRSCFVITSPRVLGLHGQSLLTAFPARSKPTTLIVPDGEQHKSLRTVERLTRELAAANAHRDCVLLALGGGVIGDITGFVAAIYQRGVDYIHLPTTLLAQVDSSVGGKTGVNLPEGKNLVGSFHGPRAVLADTATLQTLPTRELHAGLFESIKCAIMRDARLFTLMEKHRDAVLARDPATLQRVIQSSVRIKSVIVQRDEHEAGERMLLNFGHTFGHALESALGYKTLRHGEAVAWGMLAALELSTHVGQLSQPEADRAISLIRSYGPLPTFHLAEEEVLAAMLRDKKHSSAAGQRLVLCNAIGSGFVAQGIPLGDVRRTVRKLLQLAASA